MAKFHQMKKRLKEKIVKHKLQKQKIYKMKLPPTFSKNKNCIYAVIETPHGSRNKYDYDEKNDFFKLKTVLPSGTLFPLDFGFIPHTLGEDGDPLDVLVITDSPSFTGCIVECRVLGVLIAEQKEKNEKPERNDRFIAVASQSLNYSNLKKIEDVNENLLNEVIHFFEYYNEMAGKKFKFIKTIDSSSAMKIIRKQLKVNLDGMVK
jgi:inorganic pyrophosphatase